VPEKNKTRGYTGGLSNAKISNGVLIEFLEIIIKKILKIIKKIIEIIFIFDFIKPLSKTKITEKDKMHNAKINPNFQKFLAILEP
tara:strand:- start:125 stop:379 length:255 start_codon:yes stop_codon:yes gene_type:complete